MKSRCYFSNPKTMKREKYIDQEYIFSDSNLLEKQFEPGLLSGDFGALPSDIQFLVRHCL